MRDTFIENTIRLIAEGGFEKATTRAITYSGPQPGDKKLNEVYIYRMFGGKENLYEEAFLRLDHELTEAVCQALYSVGEFREDPKDQLYEIFYHIWNFLLQNEERLRCYVRFYHSVYFKNSALENHRKATERIAEAFAPLFIEEADVKSIIHSVLTSMLDFAVRVYNKDLEADEINTPHIANVLYCAMSTYLVANRQPQKG